MLKSEARFACWFYFSFSGFQRFSFLVRGDQTFSPESFRGKSLFHYAELASVGGGFAQLGKLNSICYLRRKHVSKLCAHKNKATNPKATLETMFAFTRPQN